MVNCKRVATRNKTKRTTTYEGVFYSRELKVWIAYKGPPSTARCEINWLGEFSTDLQAATHRMNLIDEGKI